MSEVQIAQTAGVSGGLYLTAVGKAAQIAVIEASRSSETGKAIITFAATYWRPIHSELMTHRDFSRNAQSSRAYPTAKLLEKVRTKPAGPIHWGKNQPGMQAHEECFEEIVHPRTGQLLSREEAWSMMAREAADWASSWAEAGYHKQIVNRIIEPYTTITTLITATEWDNWYALRAHADAQPEIQDVAYTMQSLLPDLEYRSVHKGSFRDPRTWHLPYVSQAERLQRDTTMFNMLAMSAARCARVSYLTHDREDPTLAKDMDTYIKLVGAEPLHASPLEHQAHNAGVDERSRNFQGGWVQHRAMLEGAGGIDIFRSNMDIARR